MASGEGGCLLLNPGPVPRLPAWWLGQVIVKREADEPHVINKHKAHRKERDSFSNHVVFSTTRFQQSCEDSHIYLAAHQVCQEHG